MGEAYFKPLTNKEIKLKSQMWQGLNEAQTPEIAFKI
jgi:hypothetical protein